MSTPQLKLCRLFSLGISSEPELNSWGAFNMFNVTSAELHFALNIFVDIGDVIDNGDVMDIGVLVNTAGLVDRFS